MGILTAATVGANLDGMLVQPQLSSLSNRFIEGDLRQSLPKRLWRHKRRWTPSLVDGSYAHVSRETQADRNPSTYPRHLTGARASQWNAHSRTTYLSKTPRDTASRRRTVFPSRSAWPSDASPIQPRASVELDYRQQQHSRGERRRWTAVETLQVQASGEGRTASQTQLQLTIPARLVLCTGFAPPRHHSGADVPLKDTRASN